MGPTKRRPARGGKGRGEVEVSRVDRVRGRRGDFFLPESGVGRKGARTDLRK